MIGDNRAQSDEPVEAEAAPTPRVQLLPTVTPTVADAVSDMLRNAILEGRFAPGSRLVEANMARELQVSRGSVREGLAMLAREGLVVTLPRHGKFVQPLDAKTIDEIYSIRRVLEPFAASRVVERLNEESIRQLQDAFNSIVDAVKTGDVVIVAHEDIAFHERIFLLADHSRLAHIWTDIKGMLQIMFNVTNATHLSLGDAVEQHHLILETILARDAKTVAGMIEGHIDAAWVRAHQAMLDRKES
jgi:DNA-binding GntR family transcriptional regulator